MRAIVIALAALVACSVTAAPDVQAVKAKPAVLLVGRTPLTISGSYFQPGERVVVTLVRTTPSRKRAVVDRGGRFFVSFPGVRVERCAAVVVTVLSPHGTTRLLGGRPNCKSDARGL